jgi:hypothetical protein
MSTFWTLPTGVELAIFVVCLVIARVALRLSIGPATAALLLICPVPLTYLVSGADSAVYASDIMGIFCLLWLASSQMRLRALFAERVTRLPVVLASLLLVVLPSLSTALGLIATSGAEWKLIAIGFCRGFVYLGLFCGAIAFGKPCKELDKVITIQCIAFSLICCCGILQSVTGLNLTLPIPGALPGTLLIDSATGFMGLYRGAVGAWGAAICGAIPLVLLHRRFGWVLAPACLLAVLMAIILVGSRQGLAFGLMATVFGTVGARGTGGRGTSSTVRALAAVVVLAIGGLYLASVTANSSYDAWLNSRFGGMLDSGSAVDQVSSRDDRMWYAVDRWFRVPITVQVLGAGRGRLTQNQPDDPNEVGYVDSEFVWQLQENGLFEVMLYVAFLILLARRFSLSKRSPATTRKPILAAMVALFVGACLLYGHFFLLHVLNAQGPVACWNWALFGGALGAGIRARVRHEYRVPLATACHQDGLMSRANQLSAH